MSKERRLILFEPDYVYQNVDGYLHLSVCRQATVNSASYGQKSDWSNWEAGLLAPKPRRRVFSLQKNKQKQCSVPVHVSAPLTVRSSRRGPGWAWQRAATSWVRGWGSDPRDLCFLVHLETSRDVRRRNATGTFTSTCARALTFVRPFAIRAISVGW